MTEGKDSDFDSSSIKSITKNQEKINKEIKFLEQGKESKAWRSVIVQYIINGL